MVNAADIDASNPVVGTGTDVVSSSSRQKTMVVVRARCRRDVSGGMHMVDTN
jgi:hypothetical protein